MMRDVLAVVGAFSLVCCAFVVAILIAGEIREWLRVREAQRMYRRRA